MELTAEQLDELIARLEESDKALSDAVPRDKIMQGQTDIFFKLGIRDPELMKQGMADFSAAMGEFKSKLVQLVSNFRAGSISSAEIQSQWKALTGDYYQRLFLAGAKSVGNPYYAEQGLTAKDASFISRARRFESRFFNKFTMDMQNPDFSPSMDFLDRAAAYADSGKAQFYNGMVAGAGNDVEIHWVMDNAAEHCAQCPIYASKIWTWETLPTTPGAGDTDCLFNCQCHLEIRPRRDLGLSHYAPQPGAVTAKPSDMAGRYAVVLDASGEEMVGAILQDVEDMYKEMYKARQMIMVTDGDEKAEWIRQRKQINQQIIDRMKDGGFKAMPTVSVTNLESVMKWAKGIAPGGVISNLEFLKNGQEVVYIKANYWTKGIIELKGGNVIVKTPAGDRFTYDVDTDILMSMAVPAAVSTEPTATEGLEEGGSGSGNFGHAGRPGERGGSGPGGGTDPVQGRIDSIDKLRDTQHMVDSFRPQLERIAETQYGWDYTVYRDAVQAEMKAILDKSSVGVRVDESILLKVISDGRLKNQFETNSSGGLLAQQMRSQVESFMGYPEDTAPKDRIIYGYVDKDEFGSCPGSLSQYGNIALVMKDEVRERTTFTDRDSLDMVGSHWGSGIKGDYLAVTPSRVTDPKIYSNYESTRGQDALASFRDPARAATVMKYTYWEAQIHGGVQVSDIREAIIHPSVSQTARDALTKAGIPWSVRRTGNESLLSPLVQRALREMLEGGAGSGNFGHAGRPGERGGSGPGGAPEAVPVNTPVSARFGESWNATKGGLYVSRVKRILDTLPRDEANLPKEIVIVDAKTMEKEYYGIMKGGPSAPSGVTTSVAGWYKPGTESIFVNVKTGEKGVLKDSGRIGLNQTFPINSRTTAHEVAHAVWQIKLSDDQKKEWRKFWSDSGRTNLAEMRAITKYSMSNKEECFAENYGHYHAGARYRNLVAAPIREWFDKYYGKHESLQEGGPGSGNWGHAGRPGERGGSGAGGRGGVPDEPPATTAPFVAPPRHIRTPDEKVKVFGRKDTGKEDPKREQYFETARGILHCLPQQYVTRTFRNIDVLSAETFGRRYNPDKPEEGQKWAGFYRGGDRSICIKARDEGADRSFSRTLIHEIGHAVADRVFGSTLSTGVHDNFKNLPLARRFEDLYNSGGHFPTEYSRTNVGEFFAECYEEYHVGKARLGTSYNSPTVEKLFDDFYKKRGVEVKGW